MLAQKVWPETGPFEGDVFEIGGLTESHGTCATRVQEAERGREVLEYVGRAARLDVLFTTDRQTVAPIFYACAQSYTWFLVEQFGIEGVTQLIPSTKDRDWEAGIEGIAGSSSESVREDWLVRLGLAGAG